MPALRHWCGHLAGLGAKARELDVARGSDAGCDFGGPFRGRRQDQVGGGDGRHFDAQIDTVHQRAGNARLIVGSAALDRRAPAGIAGLEGVTATAGIYGRDQHETRRVSDAVIGAGDRDLAILQRLAQRIQHARIELRQFVEEQHAVMGERNLAGFGAHAAAGQRGHARRMMRAAERPLRGQRAAFDLAGDGGDH